MSYSIVTIETAINYWRVVAPSPDSVCLSPHVRTLASVYGQMIFDHAKEVSRSTLTPEQAWSVDTAVERLNAPLERQPTLETQQ